MPKRVAAIVAYALAGLVLFAVSFVLHVPTSIGRRAVRDIANRVLRDEFLGELHIGEVTRVALNGELEATGAWLRDPDGQWIANDASLVGFPVSQLLGGLRARGPMPTVRLRVRRVWLRPLTRAIPAEASAPVTDAGSVSIAAAFRPRHPPPPSTVVNPPGRGLFFPRMDLTVDSVRSTLGTVVVEATGTRAGTGALTDPLQFWAGPIERRSDARGLDAITIASANAERAGPLRIVGTFDYHYDYVRQPVVRYEMELDLRAHVTGPDLDCNVRYHVRHDREHAETTGCNASSAVIDRLAADRLGIGVAVQSATFDRDGTGAMHVHAIAALNGQEVTLSARGTGGAGRLVADVGLRHLDLSRIRPDLPSTDLDGLVQLVRVAGDWRGRTNELHARIGNVELPEVNARAALQGGRLVVREVSSPSLGVTAHGEIDLVGAAHDAWVEARIDTENAHRLPVIGRDLRGAVHGEARLDRRDGDMRATYHVDVRDFRAPGLRVRFGTVRGTASLVGDRLNTDADVRATGLVAGTFGPIDAHGHVRGDPRTAMEADLHADASRVAALGSGGDTRVDASVHMRNTPRGIVLSVTDAPVVLHGQHARVTANLEIPTGRGAMSGSAQVDAADGSVAVIGIHGTNVTGRFRHFSAAWLGHAIGTRFPLSGSIDGDLGLLTQRTGDAQGTLRWRNGRLPFIGAFDLDVTARRGTNGSSYTGELRFGNDRAQLAPDAQHVVRASFQGRPPRDLGDLDGWLRGLRDAGVEAHNVPMHIFEPLLPRGGRLSGDLEIAARLTRPEAGAPIEGALGWDIRNTQFGLDAAQYLPAALQGLVHQTATRPLTQTARWRGAVCGRVLRDDLRLVPLTLATTLSREVGEPVVPPPAACEPTDVAAREPWLQISGGVRGPWFGAATDTADDLARAPVLNRETLGSVHLAPRTIQRLRDTQVQLHVDAGPIDTARWPFTTVAETFFPITARPRLPGIARGTVDIRGAAYSAALESDITVHTSGIEALVARDEIDAHAHIAIAPEHEDGFILGVVSVRADADARLMARTTRGLQEAGVASGTARLRAGLLSLLDPEQGLRGADFERFEASTSRFQLGRLRQARANNVEGLLALTLRGTGDPATPLALNATITDLQVRNQRPMAATANAFVRNVEGEWEVSACSTMLESSVAPPVCDPDAVIESAPRRGLQAGLSVPLRGDLLRLDPDLAGTRIAFAADAFPLDTISPLVEISPIVRVGGDLTGHLGWTARAPRALSGEIHIVHGLVDLERVGVPAREIQLDVLAEGRTARIERLALQLGAGTAEATGDVNFRVAGRDVAAVRLHATTTQLPATQEGNLYGYVTADATYDGMFRTDGHRGSLDVATATITVPAQSSRDLQELDAHGNVFIIGETRIATSQRTNPYPIDIDFVTHAPVWIRRDDFELAIHTRGHLHYDPAGVALAGTIDQAIRGSWIDIFGKRFYFDRIGMEFDGSVTLNPLLDVGAHYDSPTAGRIGLNVSGRYLSPSITFSSEQYPAATQSEILALLVLGRRVSQAASDQADIARGAQDAAGALLTGLLAGFGGTYARRQLDALPLPFVPRLIIEPGASGGGRYGVGGTITGVPRLYIEGTYGTITSYSGSTTADPSAQRPQDFHGLAEYTVTEHWSVSANFGTSGRLGADVFYNFSP